MIRSIGSVASTRIFSSVCQGLILFVLAQDLGPSNFGAYASVFAANAILTILFGIGTSSLALRLSAYDGSKELAAGIILLRIPVALMAALGSYIIVSSLSPSTELVLLLVALLVSFADSGFEIIEAVLYGSAKLHRAQASMLFRRLLTFLGTLIGWSMGFTLEGLGIAAGIVLVSSSFWTRGVVGKPLMPTKVARLSVKFWGPTILAKLQTLDVVIASAVTSTTLAGIYASASRLTSPLNLLTSSTLSVLTPSLSKISDKDKQLNSFLKGRRILLVVSASLILLSPLVGFVVSFVLGSEYSGVFWPVVILTVATGISSITQGHVSFYFAAGKPSIVASVRLWSVPASLLLMVPLGFYFGAAGIASCILILQLAQACFFEIRLEAVERR